MPTQSAVKSHPKVSDKIPAKKLYIGQFKKTNKQTLGKSQKSELDLSTYNAARLAGGYRI